jgi:hypothetical protein
VAGTVRLVPLLVPLDGGVIAEGAPAGAWARLSSGAPRT